MSSGMSGGGDCTCRSGMGQNRSNMRVLANEFYNVCYVFRHVGWRWLSWQWREAERGENWSTWRRWPAGPASLTLTTPCATWTTSFPLLTSADPTQSTSQRVWWEGTGAGTRGRASRWLSSSSPSTELLCSGLSKFDVICFYLFSTKKNLFLPHSECYVWRGGGWC